MQYSTALVVVALLVAPATPWLVGGASAADGSFEPSVVTEQQGDIVNITVNTDSAGTVNLGSPDQGFWMQVGVNKGTTTLRLNTYKAAQADEYARNERVWASNGNVRSVDLRTDPLDGPLDTAEYEMNVTVGGVEQAVGGFVVEERSTDGISTRLAPKDTKVDSLAANEVTNATTALPANGTVARGDWLVVGVDATGLDGVVSKRVLDGDRHGLSMSFTQSNRRMNVDLNEFDGDSVERLVRHPDGEGFYLFVDTSDHDIQPGDWYNATFSVGSDGPLADDREAVSTDVRIVDRKVNLDYEGDEMVVDGETRVSARTTLAPGTKINVTARDEKIPPFRKPRTLTISNDREFATTFDFSDLEPGREFEIRLRDQNQRHDAVVAGGTTVETTTEAPETNTTEPTETATDEPTETTTQPTDAPTDTAEPTDTTTAAPETSGDGVTQVSPGPHTQRAVVESSGGGVPGFDALVALVALAAAGLLAVRRS
ncbi:BGTF surface domain-containing protein [Halorussus amylolyticus]|uniref:BGTF surface domain-containing protein n=1 Tax=Halorussus amylolyticus TaxID=1126242 RepID=UPI00138F9915|nr:BGTF surface domain-containing protein [Halorussus amylolyticus]